MQSWMRFDNSPVKLVFWRGTGYIPAMVTENGIWMTDQSGEHFGTGECFEAMGDKQCRYTQGRISSLENDGLVLWVPLESRSTVTLSVR